MKGNEPDKETKLDFSRLILDCWPQNCKTIYLHCFKAPSVWQFVTAAAENPYSVYEACPDGIQPCTMKIKTFIEDDTKYKKYCA